MALIFGIAKGFVWSALAACLMQAAANAGVTAGESSPVQEWPQVHSDLKPDPEVLFGTLPNGMRYAIRRNTTPAGQAAIRFRIGSGSLEETDAQQGLAHLLEHMAYRGSAHFADGEMGQILQRLGLANNADRNANTDFFDTVYEFDLPQANAGNIDIGLAMMREIASGLTLDAKTMESERGVVLSEERVRDTPAYRANAAWIGMVLDGQLAARRFPIGKVDVIRNAPVSALRDYYQANYRPERTSLFVAGDIDPAKIETKIKKVFSDWRGTGPAVQEPSLGTVKPRGLTAKVMEVPGSNTLIRIAWVRQVDLNYPREIPRRPNGLAYDTVAVRHADWINELAIRILNRRLSKIEQGAHPPFLSAGASYQTLYHSADAAVVTATASPSGWREALAAIDREQRRIVQYGVFQEELDREIVEERAVLERRAEGAVTQRSGTLADEFVNADGNMTVILTPASYLALFETTVKDLSAVVVNDALRRMFDGAGPVVAMSAAVPLPGGDAELSTEYAKVQAVPVSAPAAEPAIVWPYGHFGTPGTVAQRTAVPGLDATAVRFANGVRLNVKPTKFSEQQILVQVRIGNGLQDLPKNAPVWMQNAFIGGGLKALALSDLSRALAPNIVDANFSIGDGAFVLDGQTRPQDLDVQMQLLAAYVTGAGYRSEAVEQQRLFMINRHSELEATATGVFNRDRKILLHSGDARWATPSAEQLEAAKVEDLKAMLQGPLSSGAIEVTIVGDVTGEAAIKATAATFGALPPRPDPRPVSQAEQIGFPAPEVINLTHKGRDDEAVAFVAWPVPDFFANLRHTCALYVAVQILENRVTHQIREVDGATYTPSSETFLSTDFPGYGYVSIMVETPPEKTASFYKAVAAIAADIREHGITPDELVRAKTPLVEGAKKNRPTNSTWIDYLSGSQADPRLLDLAWTLNPNMENVTAEDVRAVMTGYLVDERAWKLTVLPAPDMHADAKLPVR